MTALAVCRFVHFLAAMLAFGSSVFLWLYAPADLRRALAPKVRPLALAASLVVLLSAIVWLALDWRRRRRLRMSRMTIVAG